MGVRFLSLLGVASLMLMAPAIAQDRYPEKQVTLIVPFSAGGSTDVIARILAKHMQDDFGHPVIVENRSGAGGGIGSAMAAKAAKDGYTLLVATGGSHVTTPLSATTKSFDPDKDFTPISLIATFPNLLVVHKSVPANSVSELIAYLKANPNKISFGSAGTGTGSHLGLEIFQKMTGTKMTHVPFRSTGDNANSLLGGHVQVAMDIIAVMLPQTQQKKTREFIERFHENPASPAIHYEPMRDMRDARVHTARVDLAYRAVVLHPDQGDVYVLVWVDHHDEAMDWARRKVSTPS